VHRQRQFHQRAGAQMSVLQGERDSPMTGEEQSPCVVFTIGHSTRTSDSFVELLKAQSITLVADVRTIPRSRHNPQFNLDTLPEALKAAGIEYIHIPGLGGLRHSRADSPNTGWRNSSFRGFADYMQTPEFSVNLDQLIDLAHLHTTVLMCAEAVPWRCHRSLIADALTVRGIVVRDIVSNTSCKTHSITGWADVRGSRITYPPAKAGNLEPAEDGRQ
jgi:uncharacterized protein (DUF488 family)